MKNIIIELFGNGKDLTILQMTDRGILVFIVCLFLIRISGRRSFGIRTPLDNIIAILLGAVISRGVAGASPFIPTIITSLVIVLLHRFLAYAIIHNKKFARFIEGEKILLFKNGEFVEENLNSGLVCKEDVLQGVRKSALTEDLNKIDKIYIERTGEITVLKKVSIPKSS